MCSREWDIGLDVVAVKADAGHTVVVTWTDGFVGRFDVASYLKHCPASWQHVLDDGYFVLPKRAILSSGPMAKMLPLKPYTNRQ